MQRDEDQSLRQGSRNATVEAVVVALPLIGRKVAVLQPLGSAADDVRGGGDIDCVVDDIDDLWPLRLPDGIRLLQCLHYDVTGWHWIVEVDGAATVKIDTLEDPHGIGVYGFPTDLWFDAGEGDVEGVRAAYLTSKRIRKGVSSSVKWEHVRAIAAASPSVFRKCLDEMFGPSVGERLSIAIADAARPPVQLWSEAEGQLLRRRFRTPLRLGSYVMRSARRIADRIQHPTGLVVLVAGPDGSGKTTLAAALPEVCEGPFRRSVHLHWRPGLLPTLRRMLGTSEGDPTQPHARPSHGRALSLARLLYYWLDFFTGAWIRIAPARVRTSLVVIERGWWDIAVDPRRYRMRVPRGVVKALGRLLLKPDLALILEVPSSQLLERKTEISADEAERQSREWRRALPVGVPSAILDASKSADDVQADARRAIFDLLEARALSRLGSGWVSLPTRRSGRWVVPRGSRSVSMNALSIYQPVTPKSRAGWELARTAARFGAFRLTRRADGPPMEVRMALRGYLPAGATIASMRANHPDRYVAAILSPQGRPLAIAKVAADDRGREALANEADALIRLAPRLPRPLSAPAVLESSHGLLLLEACPWRPRAHPWMISDDVAHAIGRFHRLTVQEDAMGAAHGDMAPWNLLRTSEGWVLVDWEDALDAAPPYFDLFHYLLQSSALLKRPSRGAILAGVMEGQGWIGSAIRAYASGAGIDAVDAIDHLSAYLKNSALRLDHGTPDGRKGIALRRALLSELEGDP